MATIPTWYNQCENLRIRDGLNETYNPFEAAVDVARGTYLTLQCYSQVRAKTGTSLLGSYVNDLATDVPYFWSFTILDVIFVFTLAFIWTVMRFLLVKSIFEPFARSVGILDNNVRKFGESVWKTVAYGFMWSSAIFVTFFRGYDYFQRPIMLWADHRLNESPFDLCLLYGIETSWYVHSIHATLYMDIWRKDSIVMLIHHFVTLSLIFASYAVGFLKIGVIIFVLDDFSDILLESGKAATYMRHRKSGFSRFFDSISNVIGVVFAVQWVILRLVMHMTKVWRTGAIGVWVSAPVLPVPFHLFFITFLGSLFLFYAYWFFFIAMFVVRILRGKQGSAEDPREDEADKAEKISRLTRSDSMTHTMTTGLTPTNSHPTTPDSASSVAATATAAAADGQVKQNGHKKTD